MTQPPTTAVIAVLLLLSLGQASFGQSSTDAAAIITAQHTFGPPQIVRVNKVISGGHVQILVNGQLSEAYIHNLPFDVLQFVDDFNQTSARVKADEGVQYNDPAWMGYLKRQDAAIADRNHLAELMTQCQARITIVACQTFYICPGGFRQWEYQGKPTASGGILSSSSSSQQAGYQNNSAMMAGIPPDVYNTIAANSAAKWPGNYEMQVYEIKQQTEAYRTLHQQ